MVAWTLGMAFVSYCQMFQWDWKDQFIEVHTFFVCFGWSRAILLSPAMQGRTGLAWNVLGCTSAFQPTPANPCEALGPACEFPQGGGWRCQPGWQQQHKVTALPQLELVAQGRTCELLSALCDRRAPGSPSARRSTKSCVALTGLCVPAARRSRWCWAVGTPSPGGGSRVAPRFPGWGSRPPWGPPLCSRSPGRMISRSQIPAA